MKNLSFSFLLTLVLGLLLALILPWWSLVIAGILVGWFLPNLSTGIAAAFLAGFFLWSGMAYWSDIQNGSMLSAKIGALFQGLQPNHLIYITGLIGGLLASMGALCGITLRQLVSPPAQKYRRRSRRRR